jgi:hypothetical protein
MTELEKAYQNYIVTNIGLKHDFLIREESNKVVTKHFWKLIPILSFEDFKNSEETWKFSDDERCVKKYLNIFKNE